MVRAYLSIQQQRLGERLRFSIEAPSALRGCRSRMLLQPWWKTRSSTASRPAHRRRRVALTAQRSGSTLIIHVHDTGRGFAEQAGKRHRLANVRERLASLYGERARLTLSENSTRVVCATMELPAWAPATNEVRALLADDEANVACYLKRQLEELWPDLNICAEATNGERRLR